MRAMALPSRIADGRCDQTPWIRSTIGSPDSAAGQMKVQVTLDDLRLRWLRQPESKVVEIEQHLLLPEAMA